MCSNENFYLKLQKTNPLNLCTYFPIDPRKYELVLKDSELFFIKREIELDLPYLFEPSCLKCISMYMSRNYIPHFSEYHETIVIHENAYFYKVHFKKQTKSLTILPTSLPSSLPSPLPSSLQGKEEKEEKEEKKLEPKALKAHINAIENEKNKKVKDLIIAPHPANKNFSKGKFYKFYIDIRNSDGFIRANSIRENDKNLGINDKNFDKWKKNKKTQEFISALSEYLNISTEDLMYTIKSTCNELRGVYIHPELVVEYASWISTSFKIYTHKIVLEFFSKKAKDKLEAQLREKNSSIEELKNMVKEKNSKIDELLEINKRLEKTVNKTDNTLSNMCLFIENRAKRLTVEVPKKFTHIFVIWKINPFETSHLRGRTNCYTMARILFNTVNSTKLTREKEYSANLIVVYEIQFANPIELTSQVVKIQGVKRFHSFIELYITESKFLKEVQKIVNKDICDYISIKN